MGKKVTKSECAVTGGKWELKEEPNRPRRKGTCTFEPGVSLEEIGIKEMKWSANVNDFFIKYNRYIRGGKQDDDFKKFDISYDYAMKDPLIDTFVVDDETYEKYLDSFIEYMKEVIRLKGCIQCSKGKTETINFIIDKLNESIKDTTLYMKTKKVKYLLSTIYNGAYFQHEIPRIKIEKKKRKRRD